MAIFSKTQWNTYLQRLQLKKPLHRNTLVLSQIVSAHQQAIEVKTNTQLGLRLDQRYDRLITRKQGGIAIQNNLLFADLLQEIGFTTDCFAARIYHQNKLTLRLHPVIKVHTMEGAFLCDVGMPNHGVAIPLRLLERWPQQHEGVVYQFTKSLKFGWVLWKKTPQTNWKALYCFAEDRYTPDDFLPIASYLKQHPALLNCYTDTPRSR